MNDIDIDSDALRQGLAWGAIGFGAVAAAAPRVFTSVYGLADSGELRVMTRLWGSRTAALGLVLLGAEGEESRRLSRLAVGMNLADALVIAGAGPDVHRRSRVLGSLTSAAFAAAYGVLLSN